MQYFVTASLLNLRSTPATGDGNILTVLKDQEVVEVTDDADDAFYKVSCINRKPAINGYAAKKYLAPIPAAPVTPDTGYLKPVNLKGNYASRRDNHAAWQYPLTESNMPRVDPAAGAADKISTMHSIVAYLQVDKSARYQRDIHTYCNIYAYDYCYLTGVFLPRVWWRGKALLDLKAGQTVSPLYGITVDEVSANGLFAWLEDWGDDYGWTRTYDLNDLQTKVNEGRVGVICAANINPARSGHICCVIPEKGDKMATRSSGVVVCPLLSQAGAKNLPYYYNNKWWVNLAKEFKGYGYWYC
jgi:Bacterial SH3 domain